MSKRQVQADLWLLLVTLIWGSTFVLVKDTITKIEPCGLLAIRFAFAFLALLALFWRRVFASSRWEILAGAFIGLFLFAGYAFQTVGLQYTTAAKAGFITGLSVVIVPLAAFLILRQKPSPNALVGVILATLGLALLSLNESLSFALESLLPLKGFALEGWLSPEGRGWPGPVTNVLPFKGGASPYDFGENVRQMWGQAFNRGDLIVLGCAFSFALHIVLVGAFAPKMDTMVLTTAQMGSAALASAILSWAVERPSLDLPAEVWLAALFLGVVANAFAFGVQNAAQRFTSPTHTALIFSMEPVFAGLFAYLLAGETLTKRALVGCALILAGMIAAETKSNEEKIIFTLGTSTRSPEEFLALLKHYRIEKVVDVRRFPTSRFEHFKKEPLAQLVKEKGIEFHYLGKELGGYRSGGYEEYVKSDAFKEGLAKLEGLAANGKVAVMCCERLPWRCHRRFIGRGLAERGWKVVHLIDIGRETKTLSEKYERMRI